MDWLTFITKLVDSLAWPVVALILGGVFKKQLKELLPFMKKLKAGPLEAEFEREAERVLEEVSNVTAANVSAGLQGQISGYTSQEIVGELLNAKNDPSGTILEGWSKVDGELHKFGRQMQIIHDPLENTGKVYSKILQTGGLPTGTVEILRELKDLRNKVAHAKVAPSVDAAQRYLVAVDKVIDLIHNYRKSLPNYGPENR